MDRRHRGGADGGRRQRDPLVDTLAIIAAWIVGTAGLLAALVYLWSRAVHVWRFGRRVADRIDELHELAQRTEALAQRELTANGGSSMKDKLDEQCASIRALHTVLAGHMEDDVLIMGHILKEIEEIRMRP